MPLKLTTAPMSVRLPVSADISPAMSKSVSWMRMVTAAAMTGSAAGHRREKRDLAGAGDHGIGFDVGVVDRGTDHPRRLEGVGIAFAALGQPTHQVVDGADADP